MNRKIGLLHDASSLATGPRAIARVIQRVLSAHDIPYRSVDQFEPECDDLAMLVIGGGTLIRAPDDPCFRAFRAVGHHVLHSVSIGDGRDTGYLADYARVAVRSMADQGRLQRGEVTPCLSLLYGDYLPQVPGPAGVGVPDGAVGIHVTPQIRDHALGFVHVLNTLGIKRVVWLPTADLRAADLVDGLLASVPDSIVLPAGDPDVFWQVVGGLRVLVTPALHGACFAYSQRVPFLTYGYGNELGDFLRDRGLTECQLSIAIDLEQRLPALLAAGGDVADASQDLVACRALVDDIVELTRMALREREIRPIHVVGADRAAATVALELERARSANVLEVEAQRLRVRSVEAALDRIQYAATRHSLALEDERTALDLALANTRLELDQAHDEIGRLRLVAAMREPLVILETEGDDREHLEAVVAAGEGGDGLAARDAAGTVAVMSEWDGACTMPIAIGSEMHDDAAPVDVLEPALVGTEGGAEDVVEVIDDQQERRLAAQVVEIDALIGEVHRRDRMLEDAIRERESLRDRCAETSSRLKAMERRADDKRAGYWLHALARSVATPLRRWSRRLSGRASQQEGGLRFGIETDLSQPIHSGRGGALHLQGWCFVPGRRVHRLWLDVAGVRHPVRHHSQPRMDVLGVFYPNHESSGESLFSGFSVIIDLPRADEATSLPFFLVVELDNGDLACGASTCIDLAPGNGRDPISFEWPDEGVRIAICMTTCNPPPALFAEQIRSIAEQDHRNFVCIIQDDQSSDENLAAIERSIAGDRRFVLFRNLSRLGFYRNFESCLARVPADAAFVALSDHDDRWYPDKLSSLLAAFRDDTQLAYSDCRLVAPDGTVIAESYWTRRRNNWTDLTTMFVANTITGAASLFRASLLDEALPFPQRIGDAYHDQWLGLLAMVKGSIAYVDRPLYDYMQHGRNVIGAVEMRAPGVVDALRDLFSTGFHPGRIAARLRNFIMSASADHAFVTHKSVVSRSLLQRLPTTGGPRRRTLRRFSTIDESIAAIAATQLRSRLLRQPTLNMDGYMMRAAIGYRLSRPGFRLRRRSLLAGRAHEQVVLDRASGAASVIPDAPAVPAPAASERVHALGFGNVGWMSHNIRPLTLAISARQPRRVNLLLATIDFRYVFGGYIGMFNLALFLRRMGHSIRIVLTESVDYRPDEWRRQILKFPGLETLFDEVEIAPRFDRNDPLPVNPADAFVATSCWSAHVAHHAVRELGHERFLFMVQEYEPIFTAYNSINAIFRQAYEFPQYALFSTAILQDYFRAERIGVYSEGEEAGDALSTVFHNAICKFTPKIADMAHAEKRLLFYARPEDHAARNLFELGVMGLVELLRREEVDLSGWTFHGIGSIDRRYVLELAPGIDLKLLPRTSLEEYIQLLPTFDVGLSLMMSPHPSLVPLEMAAAGLRTVTNTFANKTAERLAAISPNLIAVPPTVDGIADGLAEAVRRAGDLRGRLDDAGIEWPTNWIDAFTPETMRRLDAFLSVPARGS